MTRLPRFDSRRRTTCIGVKPSGCRSHGTRRYAIAREDRAFTRCFCALAALAISGRLRRAVVEESSTEGTSTLPGLAVEISLMVTFRGHRRLAR